MTHKLITDSARDQKCTIRLPNICNGNSATTVFCHLSGVRFGHGVGIKTLFGAYGCSSCHDAIDGRIKSDLSQDYIKLAHKDGVFETLLHIIKNQPKLWAKFTEL